MKFCNIAKAISKKTMRNKDFASLNKNMPGFRLYKAEKERLFHTLRGYFYQEKPGDPTIEISVTQAQTFFDINNLGVQTGW